MRKRGDIIRKREGIREGKGDRETKKEKERGDN